LSIGIILIYKIFLCVENNRHRNPYLLFNKENPIGENDIETAQIKGFLKQRRFYTNVPKDLSDAFNRKRVEAMTAWKQASFLPLSAG
jgi:hypothetical protein